MRFPIVFAILYCVNICSFAQSAKSTSKSPFPDLGKNWIFIPVDNQQVKSSESQQFEGALAYNLNFPLENQTNGKAVNIGWLQNIVIIDPQIKKETLYSAVGGIYIDLGTIGEADETYFNGRLIGSRGAIQKLKSAYKAKRLYFIPDSLIKFSQKNILAIRFEKKTMAGGFTGSTPKFLYAKPSQLIKLKTDFLPNFDTTLQTPEQKFMVRADLSKLPKSKAKYVIRLKIIADKFVHSSPDKAIEKTIVANGALTDSMFIDYTFSSPGYRKLIAEFSADGKTFTSIDSLRFGYKPTDVVVKQNIPSDLDAFWQNTIDQLKQIDPQFSLQRVALFNHHEVYAVEFKSLDGITVRGWYTRPTGKKNLPAILELPYYTGYFMPRTDITDFAVLSLNTRGQGNSADVVNPDYPLFFSHNINNREKYIYRGVYADCIQASKFFATRPEIDTNRLAVMGISQGGGLTIATASLTKVFKIAVASVPFLSSFPTYFETVPWPLHDLEDGLKVTKIANYPQALKTLEYFDVANLSPKITCKLIIAVGLQDNVCPPIINFNALNQATAKTEYYIFKNKGHDAGGNGFMLNHIRKYFGMQN